MKIFNVVVLCCLVASSQANFLDDLGNAFKQAANGILAGGKAVGSSLLDQLKQTGLTLASTAVGNLVEQLDNIAAGGSSDSKRDLSSLLQETGPILEELEKAMADHSASQKLLFGLALKELEHVAENMTSLDKTPLTKILHMIDDIVSGHSIAADILMDELKSRVTSLAHHKRSLEGSLSQVGDNLSEMFAPQVNTLKSTISSMGQALKENAKGHFGSLVQTIQHLDSGASMDILKIAVENTFRKTLDKIQPHIDAMLQHKQ